MTIGHDRGARRDRRHGDPEGQRWPGRPPTVPVAAAPRGTCATTQSLDPVGHRAARKRCGRPRPPAASPRTRRSGRRLRANRGIRGIGMPLPPPDVQDQDVGPDEQQHEALDHQGEVAGEARVEDVGVQAPRRRAVGERAEQERGEHDPHRRVPPEEGDRDAEVADCGDLHVEHAEAVLPAQDVHRPAEPGEGARDRHRQEVAVAHADAAVARGLGAAAHCADAEAQGRARQGQPVGDQRAERR